MEYPVIVEQKNGVWRAVIPALSDLSAEGASYDEAVQRARQAAKAFLSRVKITIIELNEPNQELRRGSPKSVLRAAGRFKGDEEAMRRHIEEIYSERRTAKTNPWHSKLSSVYHNNTSCITGNNIEEENVVAGTGGRPLCKECARLA